MKDEFVDVVNEKDKIIGKELRNICHEKGLFHRTVAILLFNNKEEIWLQKRAKNITLGGLLDFSVAGHVPTGKSYKEGAYKEMEEEIGIKTSLGLISPIFFEVVNHKNLRLRHLFKVYSGKNDGPFNLEKREVKYMKAYSVDEIQKIINEKPEKMTPALRIGLNFYLKNKNAN
ncbi:NUDIX domain-containing protein [Candidatus Pacearchaeota archaeon]|nr:NUDIX domain-containing protein [Candidatus Pacearchaeota archaeon]